jgi:hypothetical protein
MALATTQHDAIPIGWLRNRDFDLCFILGVVGLGLVSAAVVIHDPKLLVPVLLADQWLLGYHHVVSTYTRLCFDRESLAANRFIVLQLPFLVIAAVLALAVGVGLWSLVTVYFYWQWFHYSRQSWGVAQVYRRKAGPHASEQRWLFQAVFYLMPLWGVLHRSYQDPGKFLGMELRVLPVPGWVVDAIGAAALLGLAWWLAGRAIAWWRGRLPLAHTLYLLTHFGMFYIGYVLIDDITVGWLAVNVWHNAQYILFVWMFNNNRFKAGIDPKARFLSTISQTNKSWLYGLSCLGISTAVYLTIEFSVGALPLLLLTYQVINFHHYIADAIIWKVRRKSLQKTLGLAA